MYNIIFNIILIIKTSMYKISTTCFLIFPIIRYIRGMSSFDSFDNDNKRVTCTREYVTLFIYSFIYIIVFKCFFLHSFFFNFFLLFIGKVIRDFPRTHTTPPNQSQLRSICKYILIQSSSQRIGYRNDFECLR